MKNSKRLMTGRLELKESKFIPTFSATLTVKTLGSLASPFPKCTSCLKSVRVIRVCI